MLEHYLIYQQDLKCVVLELEMMHNLFNQVNLEMSTLQEEIFVMRLCLFHLKDPIKLYYN